jgi:hypothetical protein
MLTVLIHLFNILYIGIHFEAQNRRNKMLTIQRTSTVKSGITVWIIRNERRNVIARFYTIFDAVAFVKGQ